jgi:uncharacterized membrane protein (DUF106 family)
MKSTILLFITVFTISTVITLIIGIYNFEILNASIQGWQKVNHPIEKFVFIVVVSLLLISLIITAFIGWLKKLLFQNKR